MRCTKEIRSTISKTIEDLAQPIRVQLADEKQKENERLDKWREEHLAVLKKRLHPVIHGWASDLKKDFPEYHWDNGDTPDELIDFLFRELFRVSSWGRNTFDASSDKVAECNKRLADYSDKIAELENEVIIQVSFVKSMEELKELLNSIKERMDRIAY